MTDISAVEISLEECRRYMARAEMALESLKQGHDNNSYTAAMKRSSSDLSDILVVVRGNHRETKSKHLVKRSETVARNEIVAPSGTHPDPNQFLCSWCATLNDVKEQHVQEDGSKVCLSCIGKDMADKQIEKPPKPDDLVEWTRLDGSTLYYHICGDVVKLKHGKTDCCAWDRSIFDTLLEMGRDMRRRELDELVKDMTYSQIKRTALNQFVKALERGDVKFEEATA